MPRVQIGDITHQKVKVYADLNRLKIPDAYSELLESVLDEKLPEGVLDCLDGKNGGKE